MRSVLMTALLVTALSTGPAFADCVGDITKIEEAMKSTTLDDVGAKKAKDLLDKAMAASVAKDDAACSADTTELMKMMGLTG